MQCPSVSPEHAIPQNLKQPNTEVITTNNNNNIVIKCIIAVTDIIKIIYLNNLMHDGIIHEKINHRILSSQKLFTQRYRGIPILYPEHGQAHNIYIYLDTVTS